MTQEFKVHSNKQAYTETILPKLRENFFVNINNKEPKVTFIISENDNDLGIAQINSENVQKMFDWLKSRGIVK